MASMWTKQLLLGMLLTLTACQGIETRTNETESAVERMRQDICRRAWKGVTTSRHDVLTDQTKLEIAQDTAARAAYCG